MKPLTPHDPMDDLIAAALHGDLTPEERTQFESRLSNDPAARAAYQEAQAMHDLLEKTHKSAQPDSAFEQRMVSGVRRKLQSEKHDETAWESVLVLWNMVTRKQKRFGWIELASIAGMIVVLSVVLLSSSSYSLKSARGGSGVFATITSQLALADDRAPAEDFAKTLVPPAPSQAKEKFGDAQFAHLDKLESHYRDELRLNPSNQVAAQKLAQVETEKQGFNSRNLASLADAKGARGSDLLRKDSDSGSLAYNGPSAATTPQGGLASGFASPANGAPQAPASPVAAPAPIAKSITPMQALHQNLASSWNEQIKKETDKDQAGSGKMASDSQAKSEISGDITKAQAASADTPAPSIVAEPAAPDSRKLVRNAQLDLEVKSFQETTDKITQFTKAAGGYVDTSHSDKGGNGKLQGTVVVKVLPQNLDGFLLKLRDLGQVNNQSVSTDDVTKDYYDTQARLENSRRMETQLQDLLKRENGKVSDLLAVERELGRVRGEIEQMQGQLKLYDFQVQYARVTMNISEKDLKQTAAYLLREQDVFSLFATDVEGTFQKARQSAESYKAQILTANLNHNSGSDVSAELVVMVAPDQIDLFLADVRGLGRVANFTRQTQRVAKDGGDSNQPADQALTEKDKVQVHLAIRSDDESRKQVALTVVAKAVDVALDQAKAAALANAGVEILSSSLNKTPQGESTAQLSVRVPGKEYAALIAAFNALGRTSSLSVQRNDDSGPGANGDDVPVIVSLSLTDNDAPLQETEMSVVATNVDAQAQQIKKDAATDGVEVKASSFERQPDGTELAQMTFRLPMAKYPAFVESLKKLGKVESLSVRRDDRPDETRTDDKAPAEISLQLHNQRGIVADNGGLWTTLRNTFGEGAEALFGSIRVIGVLIAYLAPWVFTLVLFAWIGRRIYVWRKRK